MDEEEISDDGHGDSGEYALLLKELQEKGILADGDKMAKEGAPPLLSFVPERRSNAALLASVPNVERYYEKGNKDKALLLDLMNRTNYRSRNEFIYFQEWVEWCEEFGVGLDAPIRYVVGINSEGGKAREQYTDAITTWRFRSYGSTNKDRYKPKYQEGKLS